MADSFGRHPADTDLVDWKNTACTGLLSKDECWKPVRFYAIAKNSARVIYAFLTRYTCTWLVLAFSRPATDVRGGHKRDLDFCNNLGTHSFAPIFDVCAGTGAEVASFDSSKQARGLRQREGRAMKHPFGKCRERPQLL